MRCKVLWIAAAICLSACAGPMIWDKTGGTQEQYNVDSYQCEKDARQSGYYGTGYAAAAEAKGFFQRCMVSKGYTLRKS